MQITPVKLKTVGAYHAVININKIHVERTKDIKLLSLGKFWSNCRQSTQVVIWPYLNSPTLQTVESFPSVNILPQGVENIDVLQDIPQDPVTEQTPVTIFLIGRS